MIISNCQDTLLFFLILVKHIFFFKLKKILINICQQQLKFITQEF